MYVKRLELSRDGARLLAVTTAKEIASYDVRDEVLNVNDNSTRILTPSPSLHNHVSRSQWGAACFSHDGEYVLAASGGAPAVAIASEAPSGTVGAALSESAGGSERGTSGPRLILLQSRGWVCRHAPTSAIWIPDCVHHYASRHPST